MITFIFGVVATLMIVWFVNYVLMTKQINSLKHWKKLIDENISEIWRQKYASEERFDIRICELEEKKKK